MTKAVWGARIRVAAFAALAVATASCGELQRQGQSSSYLIINSLEAASGADAQTFSTVLSSDVVTVVDNVSTIFADPGRVSFALGLKDPGAAGSPSVPTSANSITVDRYHVAFKRSDGRNTAGVDVPYAFDGAFTLTVSETASVGFTLVRIQAKDEAPLRALAINGSVISTIAEITFYGHDQTGREVSATGQMSINFANFADPK